MIFTYVWLFKDENDNEFVHKIKEIYEKENGEFYVVELEADFEERLKRNRTENRLKNKPTKRDIEKSDKDLIKYMEKFRLNSYPGEIKEKNYLRINNTNISAEEVAKMIKEKFKL